METSSNPEVDNKVHPQINQNILPPINQEMRPQVNSGIPPVFYVEQPLQMVGQQQNVVIQQPSQQNNLLVIQNFFGHRKWTTGLCDCFEDVTNCLYTCFCTWCAECRLAERLGEDSCSAWFGANGMVIRVKIRTIGGIEGTTCDDCVTITCCAPCAVCQMARELNNMGIR